MPSYLSPGVYIEEVESGSRPIEGVGTSVAAFVGFAPRGPLNEPTLVTNWSQFTAVFGDFTDGAYLAAAVYGYFANGGGLCYVVRVTSDTPLGDAAGGPESVSATPVSEVAEQPGAAAELGAYLVRVLPGVTGEVTVRVGEAEGENPPEEAFSLVVAVDGQVRETYPVVTTRRSKDNVVTRVNARSQLVALEETTRGAAPAKPGPQTLRLPAAPPAPVRAAEPGVTRVDDWVGDADQRTGFAGLEVVEEVTMVAVPDLMGAYQRGSVDLETVIAVQQGLVGHCELMGDRVAILDPPPGLGPHQLKTWRVDEAAFDSKYATLYYPWLKVFDPASGRNVMVPPCGHVAGVWARNDTSRGVHKAPANEVVRGAVALQTRLTAREHDLLNPLGVNCVRAFPGRGIRVWGARTLSSDPAWRYLNVRRLFNYLEESILAGTQWVVFEPNDDALWARVRRTVSAFLVNEWRRGALFGLTPDDAFYVKCDAETNPPEGIDAGQVVCEVGVAPVRPAEFVVFRLAQLSSGSGSVDE